MEKGRNSAYFLSQFGIGNEKGVYSNDEKNYMKESKKEVRE